MTRNSRDGVPSRSDAGVSLVEMLVGASCFGILGSIGISMLLSTQRSANGTISEHQAIEEARLGSTGSAASCVKPRRSATR